MPTERPPHTGFLARQPQGPDDLPTWTTPDGRFIVEQDEHDDGTPYFTIGNGWTRMPFGPLGEEFATLVAARDALTWEEYPEWFDAAGVDTEEEA